MDSLRSDRVLCPYNRKGNWSMKKKYVLAVVLLLSSLACNTVTRVFGDPTATLPPSETALAPAYIPPECQNLPLATIPAATALAQPTPILQANPEITPDLQKKVFEHVVSIVGQVYVYPDFNGHDWKAITASYRTSLEASLSAREFYTQMESMILELGDEHSHFESPVEVAAADAELAGTGEYVGIGVYILPLVEKQRATLISVFPDSPAEHNGLKSHDSILAVDGNPIVADGKERTEIVLGPECSAVVLTVQSPGAAPRQVMLVRQHVQSQRIIEASLLPTSDGSRVAYISLPTFFDESIPGQVADALGGFGSLDGLILDNRLNGGGSSTVVEPILSYFASGTLGEFTSRRESRPLQTDAHPIGNSQSVPLVILVGRDTVSFGEIFSGVLRDAGRAQIVGEPTLGNVEILHGYKLEDGSRLWIAEESFTAARSHENWELSGIVPDVVAYADWDTFTFEHDPSIAAAVKLLGH